MFKFVWDWLLFEIHLIEDSVNPDFIFIKIQKGYIDEIQVKNKWLE